MQGDDVILGSGDDHLRYDLEFSVSEALRIRNYEDEVSVKTSSWFQKEGIELRFDDVRDVTIGNEVKTFYAFTDIFGGTDLVTGISEIHLTELSDDVVGTSGQEVVYTHEGDDYIETHGGSDFIHAGDGQDTIIFYGDEEIFGGSGSDVFVLSSKHQDSFETKIKDFSFDDGDVLDLRSIPTVSRDDIDTTVIDENTLELSIGNLGKITLNNIDFASDENIQSKIKDQILVTENITSVEMINHAGDTVDPLSGLSGDYINFSELDAPVRCYIY